MAFQSMLGMRRPPVSRQPQRYGEIPQGPLTSTLPQRMGQTPTGPMTTRVGQQYGSTADLYRRGGPGGTPLLGSGSGNVIYRDGQYTGTFADQENPAIARQQQYGAAAGSGPYDGSAGMRHFGPLASKPQHIEQQVPVGTQYAGGSRVVDIDGRPVLLGPNQSEETYRDTAAGRVGGLNAQGRHLAYQSSGQPANDLQRAAVQRQRDNRDALRAGRNIRANQRYGAPLRPDMFQSEAAQGMYARQGGGGGPLGGVPPTQRAAFNNHVKNATVTDAKGNPSLNTDQLINNVVKDTNLPPDQTWPMLRESGVTAEQIADAHNAAKGTYGGLGGDPKKEAYLRGLLEQAGAEEQSDMGEDIWNTWSGIGDSVGKSIPAPYNPFLWSMPKRQGPLSQPPKTTPRGAGPAYRPNF